MNDTATGLSVTEARYILDLLGTRLEQTGQLHCAAHQGRLAIVLLRAPTAAEF
jgi:hypothetical protein